MTEFTVTMSILTLLAIIFGPIFAVQAQVYLDKKRASEKKKVELFKTLMATRGDRTSEAHVVALNQIDLEFYGVTAVINKWKEYLKHLNEFPEKNDSDSSYDEKCKNWGEKKDDLFVDLLMKIAKEISYDFDINHLKRGCYVPKAHEDLFIDQFRFRKSILDLLEGKGSLLVQNVISDNDRNVSQELIKSMIAVFNGEKPIQVENKEKDKT